MPKPCSVSEEPAQDFLTERRAAVGIFRARPVQIRRWSSSNSTFQSRSMSSKLLYATTSHSTSRTLTSFAPRQFLKSFLSVYAHPTMPFPPPKSSTSLRDTSHALRRRETNSNRTLPTHPCLLENVQRTTGCIDDLLRPLILVPKAQCLE